MDYLEILKHNKDFDEPLFWIDYAQNHEFKKIDVNIINKCPECGCHKQKKIGQYVYFNNLAKLLECSDC